MKKIQIAAMQVSQVILGCMRIIKPGKNPVKVIETAYENGINFFDHADIYGDGQCETVFAEALAQTSIRREDIYLREGLMIFQKSIFLNLWKVRCSGLRQIIWIHYFYIARIL